MPSPTKAELLAENAKLKRCIASLERAKQKSAAAPAEIKRLRAELRAAEQRRAATAKILEVIASSPADAQPVFNAIAENAIRLLGGRSAVVTRVSGEDLELVAFTSTGDKGDGVLKAVRSVPLSDASDIHCRVVRSATPEFHADTEKDSKVTPDGKAMARARGFRSVLSVPMLRDGLAIGTIGVTRARAGVFSAYEVGLMTTFADQAVIAIENVRLFNETKQALERQTATAEILRVISSSPGDTQPVFDAIARTGARLVNGMNVAILLRQGSEVVVAGYSAPGREDLPEAVRRLPLDREKNFPSKVILDGEILHIPDWEGDDIPEFERSVARAYGVKAVLQVPMLRNDEGIGALVVSRATKGVFDAKDIALLRSFADQAVIAIENVRLFNETKEALERQTATSEILRVIASSPSDVQPVFDAIAERAAKLCAAKFAYVTTFDGELVHLQATYGPGSDEHRSRYPLKPGSHSIGTRVVRDGAPVRVEDVLADTEYSHKAEAVATGYRSGFGVPMMRDGRVLGAISLARPDAGPIPDKLIHLLQTFADQAVIAIENVRLFNETKEALEQQTASSEILGVISSSPTDLAPVFDAILDGATRLCDAHLGVLNLYDGENFRTVAQRGGNREFATWVVERGAFKLNPTGMHGLIEERRPIRSEDVKVSRVYLEGDPNAVGFAELGGARSYVGVPMVKEGRTIGAIAIYRPEVRPFTDKQVEFVKTFAAQAVIAIENVRLFNETKEALERQTATAEILQVIASSPSEVQPVFDAIAASATRLCESDSAGVFIVSGDQLVPAHTPSSPQVAEHLRKNFPRPVDATSIVGRSIVEGRLFHVPDLNDPAGPRRLTDAPEALFRSQLTVPMIREGKAIGAISATRRRAGPFSDSQIELLKTFADQAVIAIENVRLFNETKESLEQQTASAEILKVISSSPTDTRPVFDAIVRNAGRVCDARDAVLLLRDGAETLTVAHWGAIEAMVGTRLPLTRGTVAGRAILEAATIQVEDLLSATDYPEGSELSKRLGSRTSLAVPLLQGGLATGVILIRRVEARAFSEKQVAMLQTFADQAVIAIENVRLFNETKEALERQTATAEILKVIASSPSDVQPVFDAIARSSNRLVGGHSAAVIRLEDGALQLAAYTSTGEEGDAALRSAFPRPLSSASSTHKAIRERAVVQLVDVQADPEISAGSREMALARGWRSRIMVPLIREAVVAGVISVTRREPGEFNPQHVELLKTFADQAVIAIENVRLFNETKEALERQTATAEILRVIASSPSDVRPVFDAIVRSYRQLFGGQFVALALLADSEIVVKAGVDENGEPLRLDALPLSWSLDRGSATGACIVDARPVNLPDLEQVVDRFPRMKDLALRMGYRSGLWVPLIRDGEAIGVLNVLRRGVGEFSEHEVALGETFADQAVIAIENVRLFNETKEALERQTATAEILKVIASSPADVQPVLEAITNSAAQLFAPCVTGILMREGTQLLLPYISGPSNVDREALEKLYPIPFDPAVSVVAQAIASREVTQILDTEAPDSSDLARAAGRAVGFRSMTAAPLVRSGEGIGAITVTSPQAGFKLTEKQLSLLKTFADQAVIAIENVRLFNETKEALERQTATAEILKVIASSPSDVQPVFDAIAASAMRLVGGISGLVTRVDGDKLRLAALTTTTPEGDAAARGFYPVPADRGYGGEAIRTRAPIWVADIETDPRAHPSTREVARVRGARSVVLAPMVREGNVIGLIHVNRSEPGPFSDHHVNLLQTFADQAVIAIENVRLFNETKEALERQTATAEILKVIGSSPTDTQPVFEAIVRSALRVFDGLGVGISLLEGNEIHSIAEGGNLARPRPDFRMPLDRESTIGRAILDGRLVNVPDTEAPDAPAYARANARMSGFRSMAGAPMMRNGIPVGGIVVMRGEPGGLNEKQIELLKTFADQAVIAIENVRLFKELESRTAALSQSVDKLTALGEVGQAISSTLDLETVLKTIVSRAVQLTGLNGGAIYEYDEQRQEFRLQTSENLSEEIMAVARSEPIRLGNGAVGLTGVTREPTQVPDTLADSYQSERKQLLVGAGYRAVLAVPLLREDSLLGALLVTRKTPGPFPHETVELLKTFATQSAMAIQNARLFREIAEKGRQLEIASHHKSDFLASMSHELRTPLNAILGFNELILAGIYGDPPEEMKEPLTDIQTSGKHLLRLINNVLDLAKIEAGRMELALAEYSVHDTVESVRSTLRPLAAEKGLEFHASVPEEIPTAYGDSGRITQCLMNLAGNSLKFTKQGKVEIVVDLNGDILVYRVNDTGIGIPPDKIGSLFTEFKQTDATIASEYGGTGLGLSISRKFIEMHGGRVWVESEVGKGSSFIFEVPLRVEVSRGAES